MRVVGPSEGAGWRRVARHLAVGEVHGAGGPLRTPQEPLTPTATPGVVIGTTATTPADGIDSRGSCSAAV